MSLSPHSQIQFYSTRASEPKTTFIKKSHSTLSKGKKTNSAAQQEPGAEFRITLEGWRHPADDQEFDEFMDDSYVYRVPPKITTPIRVIPSNSGMRSPMERAYSSLREEVREVKVDPVPVEPEKVRTRNRELSLEPRPSVEEPRAISPKETRLRREESRMSRQAENQLRKENREEYRPIPQVEISFKKEEKCEPKMSRQDRKDDPRVLRSVEKSSKHLMNKDESQSPESPDRAAGGSGSGSAGKVKDKRAWIVKATTGQESAQEPKLQIQNLVIQKLDKTTSSVAKSYDKPQWPVRGAIRLDKLIKNESAGVKSDKSYALLALNPPKATTIQVNFEKKPSASQLAIFEKFQILHKEAQEKEKEREKYYLEHTSPNFIPASKQKMSITKLEPTFEAPKAPIKYVHKIKTSSLHSAQNLSNSAVDLESPSTTPTSKPVTKVPKRRHVASMSLDKTHFESAGALDQLVQAILQENPPAGASWLNKTRVATRKDVACFNDYANRTGDIDMKKTTLTPLSSYKIIAESRTKAAAASPISLTKEASKLQNQNIGYAPGLRSQIEHIWSSIKHSSSSVHSSGKRQTDRFGSDKLGELNQIMTMTRSVVGDKSSSLLDPKIDINEWANIFAPPGRRTGRGRRSGEDLFQKDTPSNLLGKKDLSCPKISHTEQKESL